MEFDYDLFLECIIKKYYEKTNSIVDSKYVGMGTAFLSTYGNLVILCYNIKIPNQKKIIDLLSLPLSEYNGKVLQKNRNNLLKKIL
jgi:hypothetical protein